MFFWILLYCQDLDDMNIEIMRNTLYKAYLEDFYRFCQVRIAFYIRRLKFLYIHMQCSLFLCFSNECSCDVISKQKLGGATAEIMSDLLAFEADRRAVNITINRYHLCLQLYACFLPFLSKGKKKRKGKLTDTILIIYLQLSFVLWQ